MLSTRMNRWTFAAITLAALAAPAAVWAQTPEHTGDNAAQFPSKADLKSLTTSGSYLAGFRPRLPIIRPTTRRNFPTAAISRG